MAILTFEEILTLMDKISEKEISLVEIESGGVRLRIEGRAVAAAPAQSDGGGAPTAVQTAPPVPVQTAEEAQAARDLEDEAGQHIVTSPIVGTFYRAPNPESEPFVKEGDRVSKGAVICIIEAMKLFNEIECEVDGIIARIYPQAGQPVEYGEKLFAIRAT